MHSILLIGGYGWQPPAAPPRKAFVLSLCKVLDHIPCAGEKQNKSTLDLARGRTS